ncbi:MAG: thioredoxin [Bacteroidota bacterium]|nr:thioredoxin [Bacteroidota bacterium]
MKANFDSIINSDKPVLVDFFAEWCGPCKMQSPILKELATELGDKVKIIKIDVDQNQEIAYRFQIRSVPTLMIFKNGVTKYQQPGVHSKSQIINIINQNL